MKRQRNFTNHSKHFWCEVYNRVHMTVAYQKHEPTSYTTPDS